MYSDDRSGRRESFPLLTGGRHPMSMDELEELCVKRRTGSRSRPDIMRAFREVVERIESVGLRGEMWVDGSFLTEKLNPRDVDFVFCAEGSFEDNCDHAQREVLDWLADTRPTKDSLCHMHLRYDHGEDHRLHGASAISRVYWLNQFGRSRFGDKGIAVVRIGSVVA